MFNVVVEECSLKVQMERLLCHQQQFLISSMVVDAGLRRRSVRLMIQNRIVLLTIVIGKRSLLSSSPANTTAS